MAGLAMMVVLVASGVIFYFALATIRYLNDAYLVFANANSAMKAITKQVMMSNCYGRAQGPAYADVAHGFYGPSGSYVHVGTGSSGTGANTAFPWMPTLQSNTAAWELSATPLYLRQTREERSLSGETPTLAGDFPSHDIVCFYRWQDPQRGVWKLACHRESPGTFTGIMPPADNEMVAEYIENVTVCPVAYNCLSIRLTCRGTIPKPVAGGGPQVYEVTLTNAVTLRCAPAISPMSVYAGGLW